MMVKDKANRQSEKDEQIRSLVRENCRLKNLLEEANTQRARERRLLLTGTFIGTIVVCVLENTIWK